MATGKKRIASATVAVATASHGGSASPGRSGRGRRLAGFSLLELLVALFVVVLITSLVTLTVNSGGQDIQLEAQVRSMMNVAGYAMDEAQLSGVDYGMLLLQRRDDDDKPVYGFGWRERTLAGWRVPEHDSEVFSEQLLPPDIELRLELEDGPLAEISIGEPPAGAAPQVLLYASGETTPGAIEVWRGRSGELLWRLEWDLLGRFSLLRRGLPDEEDEPRG